MSPKHPNSPHSRKLSRTERGTQTQTQTQSKVRSPRRLLSKTNIFLFGFLLLYTVHHLRSRLSTKADSNPLLQHGTLFTDAEDNTSVVHHLTPTAKVVKLGPEPEHDLHADTELVDFLESGSIAVLLPVTEESLPYLRQKLDPILQDHSAISEVSLLAPLKLFPPISKMLRDGRLDMDVEISVAVWPDGVEQGPATIDTITGLSSEYVLVLGQEGLADLHEESRDAFVTQPFLLDVPTGLCGASFHQDTNLTHCVKPFTDPKAVSLVLPPFYIQTTMLRSFNLSVSASGAHFWVELGKHIVQKDGVGAFLRKSDKSSDRIWCHEQCKKFNIVTEEQTRQQCAVDVDSSPSSKANLDDSSSISIVMPTIDDLRHVSSMVCALLSKGYNLNILVLSNDPSHAAKNDHPFPWIQDHYISRSCVLPYSALHLSSNAFANAEAVDYWLKSSNETASVIIYGLEDAPRIEANFIAHSIHSQSDLGVTVIKLPQHDLPFCDWIGTLSLVELRNWNMPRIELSVITYDRPTSLKRLLDSLGSALHFGDNINIRVNIEYTGDSDTMRIAEDFKWANGHKFVHHRVVHAGLLTAVVESWFPQSRHSYGVLLEDDVEVSKLYYAWIKMSILRYRYGERSNKRTSIFGISLYQQKQIELLPEGRRPFDAQGIFDSHALPYPNTPYLSQIPCSWGAVYFPEHWQEFHAYLQIRFSETWLPLQEMVVPHVRSNKWSKSWKRFFIELVFLRGYVMLYPNYDNFVSLSTNHLELGSHVKAQPKHIFNQKKALFTLPLMQLSTAEEGDGDATDRNGDRPHTTGLLDLPEHRLPPFDELPILDLMGTLSTLWELEMRGRERQEDLIGCATIASRAEHQEKFEALDLFTCNSVVAEDDVMPYGSIDVHDVVRHEGLIGF